MAERVKQYPSKDRDRPPVKEHVFIDEFKAIISQMLSYGYPHIHAVLRQKTRSNSLPWPNAKCVYRVMKLNGMLLQHHTGAIYSRRLVGRVAVEQKNVLMF